MNRPPVASEMIDYISARVFAGNYRPGSRIPSVRALMRRFNLSYGSALNGISYLDFDYLESELMPYIEFGQKNQVPLYLGEFGVCIPAWKSKAGATTWVTDMLTLCQQYNLHFNYHAYHDYWFGLYRLPMNDPYSKRNEELAEIFKELLK